MAKASKWFKEVFLPSFDSKMNHPKYPNRCILSEKQANVCHRNMTEKPCHGDYNEWYNVYEAETETAKYIESYESILNAIREKNAVLASQRMTDLLK